MSLSKPVELLPELIEDILARLPVKSLIRFKCVSKSFFNLISSRRFIKNHLKLTYQDPNLAHSYLILSAIRPHYELKSCSLQKVLNCEPHVAVDLIYPSRDPENAAWIVGSVNGLICIAIEEDHLFLWNPSTKVSRKLPETGLNLSDECFRCYGFGFVERIDDYKVVGLFYIPCDEDYYELPTMLYSLRSNSWKTLEDFPIGQPIDEPGKFVNEGLHWAVTEGVLADFKWFIIRLDLVNEAYYVLDQPSFGPGAIDLTLGVLRGTICVLSHFKSVRSDLWAMMKYGVRDSWVKLCTIPYVGDPRRNLWYSFPLWFSNNLDIVIEFGANLVIYNPCNRTFRIPKVINLNGFLDVTDYVESLVAPNFDDPIVVYDE